MNFSKIAMGLALAATIDYMACSDDSSSADDVTEVSSSSTDFINDEEDLDSAEVNKYVKFHGCTYKADTLATVNHDYDSHSGDLIRTIFYPKEKGLNLDSLCTATKKKWTSEDDVVSCDGEVSVVSHFIVQKESLTEKLLESCLDTTPQKKEESSSSAAEE